MSGDAPQGRDADDIRREMATEENDFLLRFTLTVAAFAVAAWAYTGWAQSRYFGPAVDALDGQPDAAALDAAFEALATPHFFSGLRVPDDVLPRRDPLLADLDPAAVMDDFASGRTFALADAARDAGAPLAALFQRARDKALSEEDLAAARTLHEKLPEMLVLMGRGFAPAAMASEAGARCLAWAPCLAALLERRWPNTYNSLVLLRRYEVGAAFSERSVAFSRRRLAHWIAVRRAAKARGAAALPTDREILVALREAQQTATRNGRVTAIFLSLITLIVGAFTAVARRSVPAAT